MDLPCDGDGVCMSCKRRPPTEESLHCKTCATPWHVTCLSAPPHALQWDCPDCSSLTEAPPPTSISAVAGDLISAIRAIEADPSLTDLEKAKRRQHLMSGGANTEKGEKGEEGGGNRSFRGEDSVLDVLDANLNCSFCLNLLDRPVTTPCGHNFCLKCFQKWVGQGKRTCGKCRSVIPSKMVSQPRINAALVVAIRMAKMPKSASSGAPPKPSYFIHNQNRPDKAYTTERAKKAGKANACSGKIFVTVPPDHFGPILAENDPERKQGVLVGECWEDRMECRQWGAHLPHVAGIAGQSDYGAQSVALSGGYEDDEDHGEWFLYTGSGGRDLSGNKRTNKEQSFDQKFEKYNEALRVSCRKGYPVRVVRSHKEKRSSYAPESGVRYDGVYRIEKCWRKSGIQGFKVCRYLFVRCDNEPAPWTSDEHGDCPRPFPVIQELKKATDITERKGSPAWDYDEEDGCWKWKLAPPLSRKTMDDGNPEDRKKERRARRQDQNLSVREKLLKEFSCLICRKVMTLPLTTPCAHNFCKPCLEGAFSGQSFIRERHCEGRRTLRTQKNIMKCPSCPADISDFLQNPQVNRELMDVIVSLQEKAENNVEANDENLEESNEEESNSSKEKLDAVDEDDEIAIEKNEDLDFVVKDVIEDVIERKANQTNQQKKCDAMNDNPLPAQCAESKDARVSSEIADSGKDIRPTTKKSYKQKIVDEQHEKSTIKKPQALCKETKDASLKIPDSGEEGMQPTMRKTRNQKKADENHEMSPAKISPAKMSHASSTEIKDVTVSSDEIPNSSKVDAKTTANKTRKRKKDSEVDPLPTPGRRVTRSMAQKTLN